MQPETPEEPELEAEATEEDEPDLEQEMDPEQEPEVEPEPEPELEPEPEPEPDFQEEDESEGVRARKPLLAGLLEVVGWEVEVDPHSTDHHFHLQIPEGQNPYLSKSYSSWIRPGNLSELDPINAPRLHLLPKE